MSSFVYTGNKITVCNTVRSSCKFAESQEIKQWRRIDRAHDSNQHYSSRSIIDLVQSVYLINSNGLQCYLQARCPQTMNCIIIIVAGVILADYLM